MKPDNLSWSAYLRGYGRLRWQQPGDEQRYHELCGLLQPLYSLSSGNLLDRTGPKVILAQPTPTPVVRNGHAPFTFKAQCLVTGRLSRAIPYERYTEFGILTEDARIKVPEGITVVGTGGILEMLAATRPDP